MKVVIEVKARAEQADEDCHDVMADVMIRENLLKFWDSFTVNSGQMVFRLLEVEQASQNIPSSMAASEGAKV